MKATFEGRFKSIEEELDLAIKAGNMKRAGKTYAYDKDIPEIGTFKNTTSAKLFGGVKPTSSVMMQEKADGISLKLLSTIGIGNAGNVMNSIRNDPLLKPRDGNVVIVP